MDAAARSRIASGVSYGRGITWPTSPYRAHVVAGGFPSSGGEARVLDDTWRVGGGAVTYLALGRCHNSNSRMGRTAGGGSQQLATLRKPWELEAFSIP